MQKITIKKNRRRRNIMKKQTPKQFKTPVLCQAYWYKNSEESEMDSCVFIAESGNSTKKTYESQFLDYANKWNNWEVKRKNIDGVYVLSEEEDYKGRKYKITITTI
jgi:hypothetical protein